MLDNQRRLCFLRMLQDLFPGGHPDFNKLTVEEMELHSVKNQDYTKGGDPLGNFRRVAAILLLYGDIVPYPAMVAIVYALKQLDAALWMMTHDYEGAVESVDTRLRDVSVYMKLARILWVDKGVKCES